MKTIKIHLAILAASALILGCASEQVPDLSRAKTQAASGDAMLSKFGNESPKIDGDIKSQIKQYQELIAERNLELDFLKNSEDKLSKMILLQASRGCMLEQNINNLEIEIGGGRLS